MLHRLLEIMDYQQTDLRAALQCRVYTFAYLWHSLQMCFTVVSVNYMLIIAWHVLDVLAKFFLLYKACKPIEVIFSFFRSSAIRS